MEASGARDVHQHDVFICHASEDKTTVARPLAAAPRERGIDVWYDEYSIQWGDSLRQKIDKGVSMCRYGIVILSPDFFAKHWTQYELDGLADREMAHGAKVILPIWHNIDHDTIAANSPSLALRSAKSSEIGVDAIAEELASTLDGSHGIRAAAIPPDPWHTYEDVNDWIYADNVKLWVEVTNATAHVGDFSAQISNTIGFPASWGNYTRPIAWEETSERVLRIPEHTHARLFLANVARRPPCFWFYGPSDGMYTNSFHTIWQQNREFDGHIEFDLQIVNTTTGAVTIKRGVVDQGGCSELPSFTLD